MQLAEATHDVDQARLQAKTKELEQQAGPDDVVIGPHARPMAAPRNVRCSDGDEPSTATCAYFVDWGLGRGLREHFVADLKLEAGKWTITDAKSVVTRTKH